MEDSKKLWVALKMHYLSLFKNTYLEVIIGEALLWFSTEGKNWVSVNILQKIEGQ